MTWAKFGRVASLVNQRAEGRSFRLGLEAIESGTGHLVSDPRTDFEGEGTAFEVGDVLFGKLRPYLAKTWLADVTGAAVGDFHVYRAHPARLVPAYLHYLTLGKHFLDPVAASVFGAQMPRADWSFIRNVEVYAPTLPEQQTIAAYLDRETSRIDALVGEQQGLVRVLHERRAAEIARSTGWAGEAPAHWTQKRISWLFNATGSGTTPAPEDIVDPSDESVPWLTTGELRELPILSTRKAVPVDALTSYSALKVHPAGSLVIAMYGATIGRLGLLEIPVATNQACCVMSGPRDCAPKFVQYSLLAAREHLLLDAAGGGQPNVNQDKVRSFRIPIPTLDEQHRVVKHLDEQTAKIDALIAEAEGIVSVAIERRSALITAAVTGQINVHGEVA